MILVSGVAQLPAKKGKQTPVDDTLQSERVAVLLLAVAEHYVA